MKKILIRLGLVGTLIFLVFFIYFYKTSGKFRQSIIYAFVALNVFFSSQQAAHAIDQADAFTPQNPQHQSRPQNQGIFGRNARKSNNSGPGPGKPNGNGSDGDDGGIPKYPKPESIEETKRHLSNMEKRIKKFEEVTDSDSETEENEYKSVFQELPDGKNFVYDLKQGKGLKKLALKVWNNNKAKKQLLDMLTKFDNKDASIEQKSLQGFENLSELKLNPDGPRIFIYKVKNQPPTVIGFCMRKDLDKIIDKLKNKFN